MRILRGTLVGATSLVVVVGMAVSTTPVSTEAGGRQAMSGTMMTTAQKIENASSAAPASISAQARILDWPATPDGEPTELRPGTNGWTCLPDVPETEGNDPMCLDEPWLEFIRAQLSNTAPMVPRVAVGYMLAPGGGAGSNTDPYATMATSDNHWHVHPPHLMIIVPDPAALEGLPTDPSSGGPYVMWKGTPYAHIMAPASSATPMSGMMMK